MARWRQAAHLTGATANEELAAGEHGARGAAAQIGRVGANQRRRARIAHVEHADQAGLTRQRQQVSAQGQQAFGAHSERE